MRAGTATRFIAVALVAAVTAGCGTSAQSNFYTLDSVATAGGVPMSRAAVMVGPVTVPAAVDQPEFVLQVAQNRVEVDEFDRWAAPLDDGIARAVAGDLSATLGSPNVTTAPLADFSPAYRVIINVQRFDSIKGQAALVDAVWTVRNTVSGSVRSGRTVAREPTQGGGFDALAAAHSRAIAKVSDDIAAVIRAEIRETT